MSKSTKILSILGLAIAWAGIQIGCGGHGGGAAPASVAGDPVAGTLSISAQPQSQTVSEGSTATFSVTAADTSLMTYQWQANGTAISGATAAAYTTPATTLKDNGTSYQVTVSDPSGSVNSTPATLTVTASSPGDPTTASSAPAITAPPQSLTVTTGQSALFTVTATGSAPLSYQWFRNGNPVTGATTPSWSVTSDTTWDQNQIEVTVSNPQGSVTSTPATLTVLVPPAITSQPQNATVVSGQAANFSVTATGSAPLSYQWNLAGVAIPGATWAAYNLSQTDNTTENGNVYTVTVTNPAGSVTSSAATLAVNSDPHILDFLASQPGIAPAGTTLLTADFTGGTGSMDQGVGKVVSGLSYSVSPSASTVYTLTVDNGAGTQATAKFRVAVGSLQVLAGIPSGVGNVDGTGSTGRFDQPWGVAVDAAGNAYVADTGNSTIRMIAPGGVVTTLAGVPGTTGYADGTGAAALFNHPRGVALDTDGSLYVADTGNNLIRKVVPTTSAPGSPATGVVSTLAGNPQKGSTDGKGTAASFTGPQAVAVDGSHNVWVADTGNGTVREVAPDGTVSTLTDSTGAVLTFSLPGGIAADGKGDLFVAETGNNIISMVTLANSAGTKSTLAGNASPGSADGTGAEAAFSSPGQLALDASGNLYVADMGNDTIRMIVPSTSAPVTGTVSTLAGSPGQPGSTNASGPAALFNGPQGICVDLQGDLYVADTRNDEIREIAATTFAVTTLAGAPPSTASFNHPTAVALDGTGNTWVADTGDGTIVKVSPGGAQSTVTDDHGAKVVFASPQGIAVDSQGNLYVADAGKHTITLITVAGEVSTLAGTAGAPNFIDGTGTGAAFNGPTGLAFYNGNLYVADTGNNAIRAISLPGGVVSTLAGSGLPAYVDSTGAAASFNGPQGVAAGGQGYLYVADTMDNCIREIVLATGQVTTLAGRPVAGSVDGGGLIASFRQPVGVAVDPATGAVYVADSLNYTIRMITPFGEVTTLAGASGMEGNFLPEALPGTLSSPWGVAANPNPATGGLVITVNDAVIQVP
jgi:sugar lactone lactonase YvrE